MPVQYKYLLPELFNKVWEPDPIKFWEPDPFKSYRIHSIYLPVPIHLVPNVYLTEYLPLEIPCTCMNILAGCWPELSWSQGLRQTAGSPGVQCGWSSTPALWRIFNFSLNKYEYCVIPSPNKQYERGKEKVSSKVPWAVTIKLAWLMEF